MSPVHPSPVCPVPGYRLILVSGGPVHRALGAVPSRKMPWKLGQLVRQRRPNEAIAADIEPPKFETIEGPRKGSVIGYAIAVVLALAGGFWLLNSGAVQDRPPDQRGVRSTGPVDTPPDCCEQGKGVAEAKKAITGPVDTPADCCEWVRPSTRSDGTPVEGYWRNRAGCAGLCPLVTPAKESTPSQKPPIYVGPRGGRYHYSKSGNKVYEPRK
jgi:hypothetical protein